MTLHPALSVHPSVCWLNGWSAHFNFLVADKGALSVRPLVHKHESKSRKMSVFGYFLLMIGCWGIGVWLEVGRPCPPIRNDIVTPHHLFMIFIFSRGHATLELAVLVGR